MRIKRNKYPQRFEYSKCKCSKIEHGKYVFEAVTFSFFMGNGFSNLLQTKGNSLQTSFRPSLNLPLHMATDACATGDHVALGAWIANDIFAGQSGLQTSTLSISGLDHQRKCFKHDCLLGISCPDFSHTYSSASFFLVNGH